MTTNTATTTVTEAIAALTGEGFGRADVLAAIDSLIATGLDLDQPDNGDALLTSDEVEVLRSQLTDNSEQSIDGFTKQAIADRYDVAEKALAQSYYDRIVAEHQRVLARP